MPLEEPRNYLIMTFIKMEFKDIVNRNNSDLKTCDMEPIHVPGSIQPHGFLLAFNTKSLEIQFCSENVKEFVGIDYKQLLGKKISVVFDPNHLIDMNERDVVSSKTKLIYVDLNSQQFSIRLTRSGNTTIAEGEPVIEEKELKVDLYNSSREMLAYVEDTYTLPQLCSVVAKSIKEMTGYERVMIYRFDKDYNGEVIAEDKETHLESFLNLHYPHTDIPVQARQLYLKNQLRVIRNINYKPVPIFSLDINIFSELDLSTSVLRSVSPFHIQYLQNMGVGATLTISLLHKGRLWGLIACHHSVPKFLTQGLRLATKLQGHFITSQIDTRLLNEEYEITKKANQASEVLTSKKLRIHQDSIGELLKDDNILNLCNANGVSILIDNKMYKYGITPNDNEVKNLAMYLSEYSDFSSFNTDNLSGLSSDLLSIATVFPGIQYQSIEKNSIDCVIWYRQETSKEINWAGDPNKAVEKDANGLSPRKSFLSWKETVKGFSKPWLKPELKASVNFFNFLLNHIRAVFIYEEKEKQIQLTAILKEANAELENINWISTHDLQEPLRKIRMMSSRILDKNFKAMPDQVQVFVGKMNDSAGRMQQLIQDILKYTKIKNDSEAFIHVQLNDILTEVAEELSETIVEKKALLYVDNLPSVQGIPFLLKLLFSNLIYNSLNFSDPLRHPEIKINLMPEITDEHKSQQELEYHTIEVSDNGIGFSPEYNERIFKIFTRLDSNEQYTGSGIGLALCKKIVDKHKGTIYAKGELDKGARFYIQLPKKYE